MNLFYTPASELLELYRARTVSPIDVVASVFARIDAHNETINALYVLDRAGATAAAEASDARWRRGEPAGLLDGIPVTVKDHIPTKGMPSPNGSRGTDQEGSSDLDAPVTSRLREHGAVIVGKTTMPDFGYIASGISTLYGTTRNPWDTSKNSGGSSSGAGAAVAAGFGQLAIGTDIGGSVRIPSSFCGVVGLKPSYGRVPFHEPWPWFVAGPMARTVTDVALLLRVISEPDARDFASLPYDSRDYAAELERSRRGLRVGVLPEIGFGLPLDPEIAACLNATARTLENAGAHISRMPPIFTENPEPDFDRCLQVRANATFREVTEEPRAYVLPEIAEWCQRADALSAGDLMRSLIRSGEIRARTLAACAPYDYVLVPTMPVLPYAAELPWPPNGTAHNQYCFPFNMSEQPALSINAGFSASGLPIGVQFVGRRFDDAGVLQIARAFEAATPGLRRRVPF
ncbi:MAG TPA: amidase [Candidatus Elarobacter sp.]|jgi:aspartyl-tRNA(Asn)/glutamyl-tRNA(Gln) amidotransferase subunit A|nr:amidase [Candidatus Elarobacter sp.]